MSQIPPLPGANVRAPSYFVASTRARCPHCGLPTALLAVAVPPDHEILHEDGHEDGEDDAEDGAEAAAEAWQRAGLNAFLFHVHHLPDGVRDRLNQLSRRFRPAPCAATPNTSWVNHCEHCGRPLGDDELHCEPGVFMPSNEAAAANIELIRIQEPFAAVAAGYAVEPEFFAFMRQS
jgi:ribosomal protein S14